MKSNNNKTYFLHLIVKIVIGYLLKSPMTWKVFLILTIS